MDSYKGQNQIQAYLKLLCFPIFKEEQKLKQFKGKSKSLKQTKNVLLLSLLATLEDLDKKLWVAQCQSHLNITEN